MMIQRDILLQDLQKQLHATEDEPTKLILSNLIADVLSDKYAIRIWE